jgi:uncharacterized protein (UPF0248 family)
VKNSIYRVSKVSKNICDSEEIPTEKIVKIRKKSGFFAKNYI